MMDERHASDDELGALETKCTERRDDKSVKRKQTGAPSSGKCNATVQIKNLVTENSSRVQKGGPVKKPVEDAARELEGQADGFIRENSKESILPIRLPLIRRVNSEKTGEGNDVPCCRICFRGSSEEPLFSPCECKGTLANVHRSCLERWLSSRGAEVCELCRFQFVTCRTPQGFRDWIRNPENTVDRRNVLGDLVCFVLLTPIGLTSLWLCIQGANHYRRYYGSSWETAALAVLSIFLLMGYAIWISLSVRYHYTVWQRWSQRHCNVHLVITDNQAVMVNVDGNDETVTANEDAAPNSSESISPDDTDGMCNEPRSSSHKLIPSASRPQK